MKVDVVKYCDIEKFLLDLQKMVVMKGAEWNAEWADVPAHRKKEFISWVGEVKQQTFDYGNGQNAWKRAWEMYDREFMAFLIYDFLEKAKMGIR